MDTLEALDLLGLDDGADAPAVRAAYRRQVRRHHPDVAGPGEQSNRTTSDLVEAHELLLAELEASATGTVTRPTPPPPPPPPPAPVVRHDVEPVPAASLDEDSIFVDVPPDEAFPALYEAAGAVGDVAYVDRQLHILEIIVRFEGGPSCSVVMTLQGRIAGTEIFCSIESIEAAPTPPIAPVIVALVAALRGEVDEADGTDRMDGADAADGSGRP
jgi:hypothetical protein